VSVCLSAFRDWRAETEASPFCLFCLRSRKVGVTKTGVAENRSQQIGALEISLVKPGARKIGETQVGPLEDDALHSCIREFGAMQDRSGYDPLIVSRVERPKPCIAEISFAEVAVVKYSFQPCARKICPAKRRGF